MPTRTIVLTGLVAACACSLITLAVGIIMLSPAIQAAPDLRALPAIVSAAQFEMHADGVAWYWCH